MTRWTPMAFLIALTACDDKVDTGGIADTGDTTEVDEPFAPEEGEWTMGALTTVEDGCKVVEETGKSGEVTIALIAETELSLVSGDMDLACTLSDQDFSCPDEVEVQDYTSHGVDVILTLTYGHSGSFSDASTGSLVFTIDLSCEGEDCGRFEKDYDVVLPCHSEATSALSFD